MGTTTAHKMLNRLSPNDHLLATAAELLLLAEVPGSKSNDKILQWIRQVFPKWDDDSTVAWCSIFINAMAKLCGLENTLQLEFPGLAKHWKYVGQPVDPADLRRGDIVVLWRESPTSWKGHITIFLRWEGETFVGLGGNQNNRVGVDIYPKSRIDFCRRLRYDDGAYSKTIG